MATGASPALEEREPRPVSPSQSRSDLQRNSDRPSTDLERGSAVATAADGDTSPVWLREASKSFRWRWVPLPLRKAGRSVARWSRGPQPPQIQRIRPWFPRAQALPGRFVARYLPTRTRKGLALGLLLAAWLVTFIAVLRQGAADGYIEGYGVPASIWCGANFWADGNGCGLNGDGCRPFDGTIFPFRCRPDCASMTISTPHVVGATELDFSTQVIGGGYRQNMSVDVGPLYRADAFICQAAVHAGVITNAHGGCGVAVLRGGRAAFPGGARHGVAGIGFDSHFPKAYGFVQGIGADCGVVDVRWPLLALTAFTTALLAIFVSSPPIFVATVFTLLFAHVGLVSDPPGAADAPSLVSLLAARFLPAAFTLAVLYRFSARHALRDLDAPLERAVLWLGAAWVGALDNLTLEWIPISRLTVRDVRAQPGGVFALVVIVLIIFAIALGQAHAFRLEGRFRRYLALYAGIGAALLLCVAVPWLHLRLHHYVLAVLLLPGTALQTRPSLLYQGLLVGLFVNGVARWGFASVLETGAALFGSGGGGTLVPLPAVTAVVESTAGAAAAHRLRVAWNATLPAGWDGVSVLVNDVERARWYADAGAAPRFEWLRAAPGAREYFRFAYMSGSRTGAYTGAAVWEADGTWTGVRNAWRAWR